MIRDTSVFKHALVDKVHVYKVQVHATSSLSYKPQPRKLGFAWYHQHIMRILANTLLRYNIHDKLGTPVE